MFLASIFGSLLLFSVKTRAQFAYVSILSSEDFILAARVMAHTLQKHNESKIPYVVLYTEDVSEDSLIALRLQEVLLKQVNKIDTPSLKTHPDKKFQYTKLHLWSLEQYEVLVYLDLDTAVLDSIGELFHCGSFCASVRHSDKFNAGVFVLRPNQTVYEDMLNSTYEMQSYDGGDQGFMNAYFWQVKWASMFDSNATIKSSIQRLSAAYNYDVGMYYLSGKMLINPKIIHYTMAFVKPWHWYGYPVFDLNWYWHQNRDEMHRQYNETAINYYQSITRALIFVVVLFAQQVIYPFLARIATRNSARPIVCFEQPIVVLAIMSIGIYFSVYLTPMQTMPIFGWILFTIQFTLIVAVLTATYSKLRFGYGSTISNVFLLFTFVSILEVVAWNVVIQIKVPGTRFLVAIGFMVFFALTIYNTLATLIFSPQLLNRLYSKTRKTKNESNEDLTLLCDPEVAS
ncbi:hypothetical protein M3Y96_00195800 [Aphelenchoides besseyi]|nr:hypothetical protein M3Y96_00195800 [Aphelenchoides besseyi]